MWRNASRAAAGAWGAVSAAGANSALGSARAGAGASVGVGWGKGLLGAQNTLRAGCVDSVRMHSTSLADIVPRDLLDDIYRCSFKRQTGVSLKYIIDFGQYPIERQMLVSAQFLHKELPVRLAHRVAELENLPHGLSEKKRVLKVRDMYVSSFKDLRQFPEIKDMADEVKFCNLISAIYERHANVVPLIALGVSELKRDFGNNVTSLPEIHQFLDGFYMSRIGIRMLIGQHLALKTQKKGYIGLIDLKLNATQLAAFAIEDARNICMRR